MEDLGSVSLVAIALVAVAAVLIVTVGAVGVVSVAASRAQGAADACALAVAAEARDSRALGRPLGTACDEAEALTADWEVALDKCVVDGNGRAIVEVEIRTVGFSIRRTARAGCE